MTTNPTKNSPTTLLTVNELSDLLKVSTNTIYYWVNRSEIPYLKVGKHLRFDRDAIFCHFENETQGGKKPGPCLAAPARLELDPSNWSLKTSRGSCLFTKE